MSLSRSKFRMNFQTGRETVQAKRQRDSGAREHARKTSQENENRHRISGRTLIKPRRERGDTVYLTFKRKKKRKNSFWVLAQVLTDKIVLSFRTRKKRKKNDAKGRAGETW